MHGLNRLQGLKPIKKAARERGWDSLNMILLSHPDIISSKPSALIFIEKGTNNLSSTISTKYNERFNSSHENDCFDIEKVHINKLNITDGFAGKTLCTILQKLQRDTQTLKNLKSSRDNGRTFLDTMKHVKKISSGVIFPQE